MHYQNSDDQRPSYGDEHHDNISSFQTAPSYRYVFSQDNGKKTEKERKNGAFWTVFTVILCVCLSFGAGYGGALLQNQVAKEQNKNPVYAAPDSGLLNTDDPDSVLDKTDSNPSVLGSAGETVFSVSQVVSKVEDSVVVIDVTVKSTSIFGGTSESTGSGSGVIISENGYILTCHHVVENAESIIVTLNSGSRYEAAMVGSDAASDLAVLQIDPQEDLTYARQGCSADLVAGEWVVAIGNPLGILGGTVTTGIISATERVITTSDGTRMTLLQTNAAINSGNSGGGLFNLKGELVGIVNAKYAAEGVEGLAFAIPVDSAFVVEQDLIRYGYVRGVVDDGLTTLDVTVDNLRYYYYNFAIDTVGVYVVSSEHCEELKNKDRIVSVNGTTVNTTAEINDVISQYKVGDVLTVVASREGTEFTVSLTLQEYVPDNVKSNAK